MVKPPLKPCTSIESKLVQLIPRGPGGVEAVSLSWKVTNGDALYLIGNFIVVFPINLGVSTIILVIAKFPTVYTLAVILVTSFI